jgi:flagellin
MSSIMTNAAAMTALQSLQATTRNIEDVQARISTGLEVAEAADNAAYWSIATTMRSDNSALSTVQDALGLGAATVDVAYTAMNASKEMLDQIKTKLVAAKQPGVDKAKIQAEISQLQQQLEGISSSATFSGSNWLAIDSASPNFTSTQRVISSFSRDAGGNISISALEINVYESALFDANPTARGLLQGTAGFATSDAAFAWTPGDMDAGSTITLGITVDGGAEQTISVEVDDPTLFDIDYMVSRINQGLVGASASKDASDNLIITSHTMGTASSASITTPPTFTLADGVTAATGADIALTTSTDTAGLDTGEGILDIDITNSNDGLLDTYVNQVDVMTEAVINAASDLGAIKTRIDMQKEFVSELMDAIDRGIGQLVDADMSRESTRLQALQVQQQLGIQALSIANGNAQTILALFQN